MLRRHVVSAVFQRNVLSYFSGVLGYLVIVVFVVAGAFVAFSPQFFTNNLANLDQLSAMFPVLLLFLVPAITMSSWADEKKLGTAELLFTLPASDVEILLGKYLAVLAVYTIALLFSITHLFVLAWIGNPDWGLLFSTFVGYWLAGAALLSAGMFASVLTSNTTVAFVLGTVICAIPVFIGYLAPLVESIRALSLSEQLRDFELGMIPFTGVLYFVSLTCFMLYLNLIFIRRRHWSSGQQTNMGTQFLLRAVSLAVILISLNSVVSQAAFRADMTSEGLYSLAPTTRSIVTGIKDDSPVVIQAFLTPNVPRDYVPVRKRLIGLLRQFDQIGGSRIKVRYLDVEPSSEEAEEAKLYGIDAVHVVTERDGRRVDEDVFLGVVVSSPYDEVVVPFFGQGTPIEYELTRSVQTVSNEERPTVGVLTTDAGVIGPSQEWRIVTELKKQYDVEEVSPDSPIAAERFDVLMAVLPSSLTQPQMEHFVNYVKTGQPVLIFDDPFPWVFNSGFGVSNAPRQPKPSPGGMFGGMGGMNRQPPEPKADDGRATSLLNVLEIAWDNGQIAWDDYQPHPEFGEVPAEFLFISPGSGVETAFNPESDVTSGLQEIMAAFAGTLRPRRDANSEFEALLRTGTKSGLLDWDEFTRQQFDFTRMSPTAALAPIRPYFVDPDAHVLAAHITADGDSKLNAIYVADIDLISDWFFQQRERADIGLQLDNVTFVLNAVDVLVGNDAFLSLRGRRARHRTLEAVESLTATYREERQREEEAADKSADEKLEAARERFDQQREEIENDPSLDERSKTQMLSNIKAVAERKLEVDEAKIQRDKQKEIESIKARTDRQVRETESWIRYLAVLVPPIPAILLGIVILTMRLAEERRDIATERRAKRG